MKPLPKPPAAWPGADGKPVSCNEKLKMLMENHKEAVTVLHDILEDAVLMGCDEAQVRDVFEDAVLMGVDDAAMRQILQELIAALPSPKRGA